MNSYVLLFVNPCNIHVSCPVEIGPAIRHIACTLGLIVAPSIFEPDDNKEKSATDVRPRRHLNCRTRILW